jgi:hypothetical protein
VQVWQDWADEQSRIRQTNVAKRMSPSKQHLKLLHVMQSQRLTRQVHFSPSTSRDADFFVSSDPKLAATLSTRLQNVSDGRYRSIHPVKAAVAALPATAPVLSNRKTRLPTRADVGFPNALPDDVARKHGEIQDETAWESSSPRLVVLVTSDDLGMSVAAELPSTTNHCAEHLRWNGGGLAQMPLAGKELIEAMERNASHFGRPRTNLHRFLEPNPYSMMAPPLDASYSRSQGWRPRPFHDRPPGRQYCLSCPLGIVLDTVSTPSGMEALVGSLALYSLPSGNFASQGEAMGKMTEEFWFPAGNWQGKVDLDATRYRDFSINPDLLDLWMKRKHKAIFSYDPLDLPTNSLDTLYVVLQVYKLAHSDTLASCLKTKKASLTHKSDRAVNDTAKKAEAREDRMYQQFGTQLLSPLCFGVAKFLVNGTCPVSLETWPQGQTTETSLFSYPPVPESQDEFVERLTKIVQRNARDREFHSAARASSGGTSAFNQSVQSPERKRSVAGRIFKSPRKLPRSKSVPDSKVSARCLFSEQVIGRAKVFSSILPVDFLHAMLQSPESEAFTGTSCDSPKLLVDVSGDFAVVLDTNLPVNIIAPAKGDAKKRSDLLRLPASDTPAGYVSSSEFREVLYLPPRPPKFYDVDSPLSSGSALNLMFLYPRLLRYAAGGHINKLGNFTIRIRLVQTAVTADKDLIPVKAHPIALPLFHSPTPWAGPSLVSAVYTKLRGDLSMDDKSQADIAAGLQLNDEIKLRLPDVLDGSFSLEFGLFSVNLLSDATECFKLLAISTVPLTSSSNLESVTSSRITTIIPNGNHRLKLGDFQLQIETRLVSSVHVGDPSVAAVLKYFPTASESHSGTQSKLELSSEVKKALSVDSTDFDDSCWYLLSTASPSTVVAHFRILLHIHLCNLVNSKSKGSTKTPQFLVNIMQSLFEIIRKVKRKFESESDCTLQRKTDIFLKNYLDSFDEAFLSPVSSPRSDRFPERSNVTSEQIPVHFQNDPNASEDEMGDKETEQQTADVAIRKTKPTLFQTQDHARVSRIIESLGRSGVPFSRVAYGASKTDRMRIQAELHCDLVNLFDDDDTIATIQTFRGANRSNSPHTSETVVSLKESSKSGNMTDDNSIVRSSSSPLRPRKGETFHVDQSDFAKRVKSVAQVILAPCVGPSLANAFKTGAPKWAKNETAHKSKKVEAFKHETQGWRSPGTDDESEGTSGITVQLGPELAVFRGQPDGPIFVFSLQNHESQKIPVTSGDYLYESIIVLWLCAWLEFVDGRLVTSLETANFASRRFRTVPVPVFDSSASPKATVLSFFAHMGFLLPLCLKSLILRYSIEVSSMYPASTRAIVDQSHMVVLEPFIEMLVRGLLGKALHKFGSPTERASTLLHAMASADEILDFLVGLLSIIHPEHMRLLLTTYFKTLRDCETEQLVDDSTEVRFEWTEEFIHRVHCSRQLRLHAVEKLATLPSFLSLNFPLNCVDYHHQRHGGKMSWVDQHKGFSDGELTSKKANDIIRLPESGWLASIVINEGLAVCSVSCESVVVEAMAHEEVSQHKTSQIQLLANSTLFTRPGAAFKRKDFLVFQSIAIHAIICVYELIIRRHSMDRRFQTDSHRERIAAVLASPILERSVASSRWLARMGATHKIRTTWLLCFVYILQEAPESLLRVFVRQACDPKDLRIHRFIRLLRLCSSTFQSCIDIPKHSAFPSHIGRGMAPWLLQESFNTICASIIIVVEEGASLFAPHERRNIIEGILDVLLHVLATPQSSVTHLRAVGGALQTLDLFGADMFVETAGNNLQHWIRVILNLMNSSSLSVRSIAVDFMVSLLGGTFDCFGNVDDICLIFVSVLPEVCAREIALCSVSNLIVNAEDIARALWPLRRSIGDLEDISPKDDCRIDPQLAPILSGFCRACQAIVDGVLIEMRLKGRDLQVLGAGVVQVPHLSTVFDADEESLFEAANFFVSETAPVQRMRWLLTLRSLQVSKGLWTEAAESLILCARTISDSLPHLKSVWRPSRFVFWSDSRRSLWLDTIGEDSGIPDEGNSQVMDFADGFLEPDDVFGGHRKPSSGKLQQPTVSNMCNVLIRIVKESVDLYMKEGGIEELAYSQLESLLRAVMNILEVHKVRNGIRKFDPSARKGHADYDVVLRKVVLNIRADLKILVESIHRAVQKSPSAPVANISSTAPTQGASNKESRKALLYVFMRLYGKKPPRFQESTTIPTFLEWDIPCVCRIPKGVTDKVSDKERKEASKKLSLLFADVYIAHLRKECGPHKFALCTEPGDSTAARDDDTTYLCIFPVDASANPEFTGQHGIPTKRFLYQNGPNINSSWMELTVAHSFPCPVSRQRAVLSTELYAM